MSKGLLRRPTERCPRCGVASPAPGRPNWRSSSNKSRWRPAACAIRRGAPSTIANWAVTPLRAGGSTGRLRAAGSCLRPAARRRRCPCKLRRARVLRGRRAPADTWIRWRPSYLRDGGGQRRRTDARRETALRRHSHRRPHPLMRRHLGIPPLARRCPLRRSAAVMGIHRLAADLRPLECRCGQLPGSAS